MFGSMCATLAGLLCLAYGFAGCLNPLTDDQPSVQDSAPVAGGEPAPPPGALPTLPPQPPEDNFVDQGASEPQVPSSNAADAGVEELDAGPDSGSINPSP